MGHIHEGMQVRYGKSKVLDIVLSGTGPSAAGLPDFPFTNCMDAGTQSCRRSLNLP
jgi:hypothetical protein